jgi:EAL domain-containing protein (putative c-di-GMP-specific phosphodiesterase class I)
MGKSLQPLNAMAVRPPANTPAASAAPAASEPVTAESLGWQLRAALPPLRLHSVSLYDEQANVLWLSEGALGPDEHNIVLEAMDTLANDRGLACHENGLEDGRVAIFLPVCAPQGDLVGIAMILADLKSVSDGVLERIVSPQVRTIMQKIAVLLRASPKSGSAEPPAPIQVAIAPVVELAPERASASPRPTAPAAPAAANAPAAPAAKLAAAAPAKPALNSKATASPAPSAAPLASPRAGPDEDASLSPQAIDDILEFELFPDVAAASPPAEGAVPTAAPAASQAATLAWDQAGDDGLELVPDDIPVAQPHEPAKAVTLRSAAPTAHAASAAHAAPTAHAPPVTHAASFAQSVPTAHAAPTAPAAKPSPPVVNGAPNSARSAADANSQGGAASAFETSATAHAPAGVPTAHAANGAPSAAPAGILLGSLEPPIPTAAAAAHVATPVATAPAPSANAAGNNDSLSTTALNVALPSGGNAPAATAKSTNATTTTKAIPAVASTGTARALNNGSATASVPALNVTATSRTLAFDPSNLILDVQPFSKLRAGGRMRRYEVLPRIPHRDSNRAPAAMDSLALQRLLSWLGSNRSSWSMEPTSFSLNISISTLEDPRFPQHVASCLKANGIAPDNLGFEIAEPLCTQHRAQVERFISLCDKLGCFVVIDDFSFDSTVLPLLRSKALRLVKIDPKLTSIALRDKLSQAMVVAIVQAVKVLGIHCAAKRVESQASLQWLTAIGCDLAQGPALSQVLPIESLNMPQAPAAPAAEPPKAG